MSLPKLVIAIAACLCIGVGAEDRPRPEYSIKEDLPRTGSMIRRPEVGLSNVPLNLSYGQLSPGDRAKFNQQYERIAPGDEPPFPLGGLREIYDPLRKAQAALLVPGNLFLIAKIDGHGATQEVQVIGSPDPKMTKFAARVLLLTKFKPAKCSGQPCTMEFPLCVDFQVE